MSSVIFDQGTSCCLHIVMLSFILAWNQLNSTVLVNTFFRNSFITFFKTVRKGSYNYFIFVKAGMLFIYVDMVDIAA